METVKLPKGYFFRVIAGSEKHDMLGVSRTNGVVQLRRRWFFFFSSLIMRASIYGTSDKDPSVEQLHQKMTALLILWEEEKAKVSPYGDYPPKKLEDLK